MEAIRVDDAGDPRLADFRSLRDPARDDGFFIAEGELVIRQLVASPYAVRAVLLTATRWERLRPVLGGLGAPGYVAPLDVMRRVTGFDIHRGAVASAARPHPADPMAVAARATTLAVLEDLTDHENLGAVFRNAAAFGVGGVLLSPRCADPLYRRAVRVSMGHVLRMPFARLAPWPDGLGSLAADGWEVVALTPDGEETVAAIGPPHRKVALLLGTEGPGLSAAARAAAARRVRIPMAAGVDSLNVATAAAIAFHRLSGG